MATCVQCHKPVDDRFEFCPACGADNRPPENRTPITYCNHQFIPGMPCCVLCGESQDDPVGYTPTTRHRAVILWTLGGCLFLILLVYLLLAGHTENLPLSSQAHELFGYQITRYDSYRHSYGYYSYRTDLGTEFSFSLGFLALASFTQAYRLQKKLGSTGASDIAEMVWWQWFWF